MENRAYALAAGLFTLLLGFGVVAAALCVLCLPVTIRPASADGSWEVRMATIAPKSSKPMRILRAWDMSLQEKTGGRVKFRIYPGGVQGAGGAGHVAHVIAVYPDGWFLVSEMNFYWNGGGWARVDYRYAHMGSGVMFIY